MNKKATWGVGMVFVLGVGALALTDAGRVAASRATSDVTAHRSCPSGSVAFMNVAVLPMDGRGFLREQTVVVRGSEIVRMGPSERVVLPRDVVAIDGRGQVLIPGMTDAHVHLNVQVEEWLPLFLANGVTTVFNQRGTRQTLDLRARAERCEIDAPTIYTSGPFTNQPEIRTAADARAAVREQRAAGYDFLKIHGNLDRAVFDTMIEEGRREGFAITGHAPRNLPFSAVLENEMQLIAHAEELIYTHFQQLSQAGISELADRMATAGTWLIPTLSTFRNIGTQWGTRAGLDEGLTGPTAPWITPSMESYWENGNPYLSRDPSGASRIRAMMDFQQPLTRTLHDAGVGLLAGTDTPLPVMVPGFSVHQELEEFGELGLSEAEILRIATRNAGDFVAAHVSDDRFGRVAVGYRADLVLLAGDPTQGLEVLRRPAGVMSRGRWYDRAALDELLDGVAEAGR